LRSAFQAIWFVIVPALLAGLYLRYLVPESAQAQGTFSELIARLGSEQPVPLAVGLFLLFAVLLRYWRCYLPGGKRLTVSLRQPRSGALRARGRQTVMAIGTAALAGMTALLLRSHVLTPCRVLSASMLPTLSPGDLIATDRQAYRAMLSGSDHPMGASLPRRGDIVVFRGPGSDAALPPLIKRVIGLPGDRIGMHGSRPTINGWETPACDAGVYLYVLPDGAIKARLLVEFLEDQAYLTIAAPPAREFPEPYDVKPGEVFVLGDNRNNSSDSRAWHEGRGGGVPLAQIDGRARWFLLGTRRDERADVSRMLESIAGTALHLEALDVSALREDIAKCLRQWPRETRAPRPGAGAPAGSSLLPAPAGKMIGE